MIKVKIMQLQLLVLQNCTDSLCNYWRDGNTGHVTITTLFKAIKSREFRYRSHDRYRNASSFAIHSGASSEKEKHFKGSTGRDCILVPPWLIILVQQVFNPNRSQRYLNPIDWCDFSKACSLSKISDVRLLFIRLIPISTWSCRSCT